MTAHEVKTAGARPRRRRLIRHHSYLLMLACLAFVCGCAAGPGGPAVDDVLGAIGTNSGAYIEGVPVMAQEPRMCGPASLATVVAWYDAQGDAIEARRISEELIVPIQKAVYEEALGGTLPMDLLLHARAMGFAAEFYEGSIGDLRDRISGGEPLILFLNLGLKAYPAGHFVVAVGYSDIKRAVVVHWGGSAEETIGYDDLERSWSKTAHSTLLIRPEGER